MYCANLDVLFWSIVIVSGVQFCDAELPEEKLLHDLFRKQRYNAHARPASDPTKPVEVTLSLQLLALHDVNTKGQTFAASGWLKQVWRDPRIVWNPKNYSGIEQFSIKPTKVWVPDVTLDNSAGDFYNEMQQKYFRVVVDHTGSLSWEIGGNFVASCDIDVTFYPFDEQMCEFVFANWAYSGTAVNLTSISNADDSKQEMTEALAENSEWVVLDEEIHRLDKYFVCCPDEPYGEVHFKLYLERRPLFYYINIVCPTVMLAVLVLLVFLLPPDAGEKISMGVTLLLAFSVFMLLISENVPNTSLAVPLIQVYLLLCMAVTCFTVIIAVIVMYIHHHGAPRAPLWLRRSAFQHISRMLVKKITYKYNFTRPITKSSNATQISPSSKEDVEPTTNLSVEEISEEWKAIARIFDQFFFWVFFVVFCGAVVTVLAIIPIFRQKHSFLENNTNPGRG